MVKNPFCRQKYKRAATKQGEYCSFFLRKNTKKNICFMTMINWFGEHKLVAYMRNISEYNDKHKQQRSENAYRYARKVLKNIVSSKGINKQINAGISVGTKEKAIYTSYCCSNLLIFFDNKKSVKPNNKQPHFTQSKTSTRKNIISDKFTNHWQTLID
jgi:hypothetical protein